MRNLRAIRYAMSPADIIHVHDPELLLLGGVASLLGRSVVFDVHEFYYEKIGESGWIPRTLRGLMQNLYSRVERLVIPKLAGVVVVSPQMLTHYSRLLDTCMVALVQNFPYIDREEKREALNAPRPLEESYVVHTGGASKLRAFDVVVGAAEKLRSMGCNSPIINLGEVDLSEYPLPERASLKSRAKAAGVEIVGPIPYREALRWIAHADVGYIPLEQNSNNMRGAPNKLFEYFLFGLPTVATDLGRISEIMTDTRAGILVPPADPTAHAEALRMLLVDPEMRATLAANAAESSSRFSFEPEFDNLRKLYERIDDSLV